MPYLDVQFRTVVFAVCLAGTIYSLSTVFIQIYEGGKGKNGSTVAVCCTLIEMSAALQSVYLWSGYL